MNDTQAVATAITEGIIGQTDLITSLSLAVIGGLLALMIQVRIHNAAYPHPSTKLRLNAFGFFITSLILAGMAITLGLLISGMMIEITPLLFAHEFKGVRFSDQGIQKAPIEGLRGMAITQQVAFATSVGCAALVMLKNKP